MKKPEIFLHYNHEPIEWLVPYDYDIKWARVAAKPAGLWFSVEDYGPSYTWKTWCLDNDYNQEGLQCVHEVKFKSTAKLLVIQDFDQLKKFSYKYDYGNSITGKPCYLMGYTMENGDLFRRRKRNIYLIKWEEVREIYSGIIIAPHIWGENVSINPLFFWYQGWDCSSGCVWNLKCIESFKLIRDDREAFNQQRMSQSSSVSTEDTSMQPSMSLV